MKIRSSKNQNYCVILNRKCLYYQISLQTEITVYNHNADTSPPPSPVVFQTLCDRIIALLYKPPKKWSVEQWNLPITDPTNLTRSQRSTRSEFLPQNLFLLTLESFKVMSVLAVLKLEKKKWNSSQICFPAIVLKHDIGNEQCYQSRENHITILNTVMFFAPTYTIRDNYLSHRALKIIRILTSR